MGKSLRQNLKSNAFTLGGPNASAEAARLLKPVPDLSATGFVRPKHIRTATAPRFEGPVLSAARLISILHERGEELGSWTKWGQHPATEILFFSSERDAVLAKLLLSE